MAPIGDFVRRAARQDQFLEIVDRDEARRRFHDHLRLAPLGAETIGLAAALGRVLAADIVAPADAPAFDRSVVDGFAVRAADTAGAGGDTPRVLAVGDQVIAAGVVPHAGLRAGQAMVVATGGMVPRGADAVVMVEHTEFLDDPDRPRVEVRRAVAPGQNIAFAGSDIGRGETILRARQVLGAREIGTLAAVGVAEVSAWRRPRVAVLSTGDEIVPPGAALGPGQVYDTNGAILAAAIAEAGGEAVPLGIAADREDALGAALARADGCDMIVLSGGTSKGAGDVSYRVVAGLGVPGVLVHGVALKPGKPLCLAVVAGRPVVILPGFPTSAMFTFHEFVAPVIRALAGLGPERRATAAARLPVRVASERGRTEYVMVSLVATGDGLAAYPLGKGSGAITAFAQADGFVTVPRYAEHLEAGMAVEVTLLGAGTEPADLVIVGSHCVGLDIVVGALTAQGLRVKVLSVGSQGGLGAALRGECDVAPIHLLDPATGAYNTPFLDATLALVPGYRRLQGLVHRPGDPRFAGRPAARAVAAALSDPDCAMVNRNAGSGTRVLIDGLVGAARPPGWWVQAKSHNAVVAAIAQGRADWGVAIETVARDYGLGFIALRDEHYDFAVPKARFDRAPVRAFLDALDDAAVRAALAARGFRA